MTAPSVLEARDIHFAYGDLTVLAGVSLSLSAREILALVGPNGAGKSTLLKILGGFLKPVRGDVCLDGRVLRGVRRRELSRSIAYVPQEYSLDFPFTVGEVVLMGRYPYLGPGRFEGAADLQAAQSAMERTDVWSLRNRRFDELSGGERRRVVLAQAFCQEARIILLDEPTSSLDAAHELALGKALLAERARRGLSVVLVTHDLGSAARLADRIVCLARGTIVAEGQPLDVLRSRDLATAFGVRFHVGSVEGGPSYVVPLETL